MLIFLRTGGDGRECKGVKKHGKNLISVTEGQGQQVGNVIHLRSVTEPIK